jgi:hypothetical protein
VLGFRASPGAEEAEMRVVVDRKPPEVLSVEMAGARGIHTSAENPVLAVRLGEPRNELRRVFVKVTSTGVERSADPSESEPDLWTVQGVHTGDGEQTVEIGAEDLAGNRTPRLLPFRFVRDVKKPALDVGEVLAGALQVREASGNQFSVLCSEDAELKVSFLRQGESVPMERAFAAAKKFDVPLPDVSAAGTAVTIVATDAAGNATESRFDARVVPDEASLLSQTGEPVVPVKGGEERVLNGGSGSAPRGGRRLRGRGAPDRRDGPVHREPPGRRVRAAPRGARPRRSRSADADRGPGAAEICVDRRQGRQGRGRGARVVVPE